MSVFKRAAICSAALAFSVSASAATLEEVVSKTISTNPDVLAAINERLSRDHEIDVAKAGYLPTVDLSAGYGYEKSNNSTTRSRGEDYDTRSRGEAAVDMRQMLFDGFATQSEVERQTARTESSAYGVYGTSENIARDAAEAYMNVLRDRGLLAFAEENNAAHERVHDQIKKRSRRGVGRKAELDQTEGRMALSKSNVIAAQNNLRNSETEYVRVVGSLPDLDLVKPANRSGDLPTSIDDAAQVAVDNNPTLKSAGADVQAAVAQYEAAKANFYPRFDVEVGQSWNNDLDGQPGTNEDVTAMLRMRYNLVNGGADMARRKQTAYLINQAKEVQNLAHRQVVEATQLAWNTYKAVDLQYGYLQQHVDSQGKTLSAYQKQFNIGQRTLLDVLDAENEMFEAQQELLNAEYDRLIAQVRILATMGNLLQSLQVSLPTEATVAQK